MGDVLKILFLRSNPADPDPRVEKEVKSLLKQGHEINIFCWNRSKKSRITKHARVFGDQVISVYTVGVPATFGGGIKKNLLPLFKFELKMFLWIRKNISSYDAIHACDFDTAYIAYLATKRTKVKLIYDIFDYYVDSFSVPTFLKNIIEKLDINVINNSDATIICSEDRVEQIKKSTPKKLVIVHNSPPDLAFDRKNFSSNIKKVVYIGVLGPGRMILELADFISKTENLEFHVAGFGILEDNIKEMAEKANNIFYYGKIEYQDALSLASNCDIIPAIYDPKVKNHRYAAPNKFYESLMLQKPIIMAKGTGMSNIVEKNNLGILIDYEKANFKEVFQELFHPYYYSNDFRKKVRITYQAYRWDEMEKRINEIYGG